MELLYLWVHQSDNEFIKNKGFNFSPTHCFKLISEKGRYHLLYHKIDTVNVFSECDSSDVLSNVTAIVGKNGAGKTTLLKYIYRSLMPLPHKERQDTPYLKHDLEYNECKKSIWIFRDDSNQINVYCYLDNQELEIDKSLGFRLHKLDVKNTREFFNSDIAYNDITTIYLTNSIYQDLDGYQLRTELSKCALTPVSVRSLSNSFYKSIMKIDNADYTKRFKYLQNIIKESKTDKEFQQICDILFFQRLYKNNLFDNYRAKVNIDLIINFRSFMTLLLDKHHDFPNTPEDNIDNEPDKLLYRLYVFTNKSLGRCSFVNSDNPNYNFFVNLYGSLFMEISFIYALSDEREEIADFDDYEGFKKYLEKLVNDIRKISKNQYNYYSNALKEIKSVEILLAFEPNIEDGLPHNDLAKKKGIIVSYKNKAVYAKFLELIFRSFSSNKSFILKYIHIGNLAMSSGERAFQNYFSWLNLLPYFNKINNGKVGSLKKNVLLLIDEIDLYLHPDWQRVIIDFLIDELRSQFKEHRVQVVFATHSPIVLSDIPKMNTIYLKINDGQLIVDKAEEHKESFAANIYNILDDSFYLSNAMGQFSEKIINGIIEFLNNSGDSTHPNYDDPYEALIKYEMISDIIGEPILRKMIKGKLLEKMDSKEKLESLFREKQRIEQLIEDVEKGQY